MTASAERAQQGRQTWKVLALVGCGGLAAVCAVAVALLGMGLFGRRIDENKQLAAHVPSWVPLYAGARANKPTSSPNMDPRKVEGVVILFTSDPQERVIDYYTGRLRALGFVVDPLSVEEDRVRLLGRAPRGGRELEVTTGPNTEDTWIDLRYKWDR
jgi:hypothetical protein